MKRKELNVKQHLKVVGCGSNRPKKEAEEVQQKKIIPKRRYRDEGNSSVYWLKEDSALSIASEVNTVVRQKQKQPKMVPAVISQGD